MPHDRIGRELNGIYQIVKFALLLAIGTIIIIVFHNSESNKVLRSLGSISKHTEIFKPFYELPAMSPRQMSHFISSAETVSSMSSKEMPKEKKTHIYFLKVHKAGSTTMHNMMMRFGYRNNLNLLLPTGSNVLGKRAIAVEIPQTEHFDILAVHTTYNQTFFDMFLPNDTVNIAIVREPVDRFISAAYYYRDVWEHKHLVAVPRENFIHELVKNADLYETKPYSTTKNAMGRDFGFNPDLKFNETDKINAYIEYLDKQFSLVMLMEMYDESLILLRRLLNWSHLEIIYLPTNSHTHEPVDLSPAEITLFRQTCFMDFAIYEHFEKRFKEKMQRVSEDFDDELNHFRNILKRVKEFCANSAENDTLHLERSKWSDSFDLRAVECLQMTRNELRFIGEVRKAQYKRHNITVVKK